MSTKTTYSCDRCKSEFSDRKAIKSVSAGVGEYAGSDAWFKSFRQDWCHNCLKEFGLPYEHAKAKDIPPSPPPTLDDMLRELIRHEVQQ
jgi:DNA-directed RNA polymerase subunit RPC12/RpoP